MKILIDKNLPQFKANLHCHTVLSDGKWTPEKVKEEYKKKGYSVVAITDHEHLVSHNDLTDDEFLFITAYEAYIRNLPFLAEIDGQSHINLYSKTPDNKMLYYTPNHTKYIPKEELDNLQYHYLVENRELSIDFMKKMIKDAIKHGFLVCHNHPTWSFEDESFAEAYEDCFAMEIHNYSAYMEGHDEFNEHYYNYQLNHNRRMALIAADDNHDKRDMNDPLFDSFGGFTYILADKLDYSSVISAMENKNFYASCGPQIFSLTVEDGVFRVETSPATRIMFITNSKKRGVFAGTVDKPINFGEFKINDTVKWVYVEVTDKYGKKAYTRAYFIDEL